MKKLTMFCTGISNLHLTKDIVVIPYLLGKNHGYESEIITYEISDELVDKKNYLDNLDVNLIKSDEELKEKLIKTDLLMLFGIYNWNLELIPLYKSLNPSGKIYLKLDANIHWMFRLNVGINENILNILRQCTLITVEGRRIQRLLNAEWGLNIQFIPNGYYNFIDDEIIEYEDKKNIIMFAGRIGTTQKSNEILLEAFKNIEDKINDWKIELAGPAEESFLIYFDNYLQENPHLKERVKLIGNLDKKELKNKYKESKVFCMTSILEACANVLSEAISNGCYMIISDVDGAIDVIDYGKYGSIFPIGELKKLEETLINVCTNEKLLEENCKKSQLYARENLSWIKLCEDLNKMI